MSIFLELSQYKERECIYVKQALKNQLLVYLNGKLFHFRLSQSCIGSNLKWVQLSIYIYPAKFFQSCGTCMYSLSRVYCRTLSIAQYLLFRNIIYISFSIQIKKFNTPAYMSQIKYGRSNRATFFPAFLQNLFIVKITNRISTISSKNATP